jgi:hypothetical protein
MEELIEKPSNYAFKQVKLKENKPVVYSLVRKFEEKVRFLSSLSLGLVVLWAL